MSNFEELVKARLVAFANDVRAVPHDDQMRITVDGHVTFACVDIDRAHEAVIATQKQTNDATIASWKREFDKLQEQYGQLNFASRKNLDGAQQARDQATAGKLAAEQKLVEVQGQLATAQAKITTYAEVSRKTLDDELLTMLVNRDSINLVAIYGRAFGPMFHFRHEAAGCGTLYYIANDPAHYTQDRGGDLGAMFSTRPSRDDLNQIYPRVFTPPRFAQIYNAAAGLMPDKLMYTFIIPNPVPPSSGDRNFICLIKPK